MIKFAVCDDEPAMARKVCEFISRYMQKKQDTAYHISSFSNSRSLLESSCDFDMIFLDIQMEQPDGMETARLLRRRSTHCLLVFVTVLKECVLDAFEVQAYDYLIKPFAFEELLARLRVLLRKPTAEKTTVLKVADLTLQLDTRRVFRGDQEIELSSKEYSLLRYMMQNAGLVLSRDKLEQHVWDYDFSGGSNVIDVYIRYLRKKIDDGHEQKLIHTVRGHGYVLRGEES